VGSSLGDVILSPAKSRKLYQNGLDFHLCRTGKEDRGHPDLCSFVLTWLLTWHPVPRERLGGQASGLTASGANIIYILDLQSHPQKTGMVAAASWQKHGHDSHCWDAEAVMFQLQCLAISRPGYAAFPQQFKTVRDVACERGGQCTLRSK
jgi:hypothetical protein